MEGCPQYDRPSDRWKNAFRAFPAEIGSACPERSTIYIVLDSEGRHVWHHPVRTHLAESDSIRLRSGEPFASPPVSTALAASEADGEPRTVELVWPPRHSHARPAVLVAVPVLSDGHERLAFAIAIEERTAEAGEQTAWMRLACIALASRIRACEAESRAERLQARHTALEQRIAHGQSLFDMAVRLHARTDADEVLTEFIRLVEKLVPGQPFELFLSQDQASSIPSVKPLQFRQGEEDNRYLAFMEGRPIVPAPEEGEGEAVFPLRGKQGVYGVVRISAAGGRRLPSADVLRSVELIADTAGSAFENAKLYGQSNRMVQELRLINEITQRLNQSLKLQDIFLFASTELRSIFDAEFSCILELDKPNRELIVRASEPASFFSEHFSIDYGFSGRVVSTKEPVIISDYCADADASIRSVWMESTNSRSLLACPILVDGTVEGVILVAHRKPHYFTYDHYKLLQTLSGHIGLAIANASLHAEVRRMVQTDRLTGLFARHYLDDQIGLMQKKDNCGSLIVVDIDDFKKVNDTHGHQIGDRVLIQVGGVIRSCIREGDIASRWGGEELAVYLPQMTKEQAVNAAERIRRRVQTETSPKVSVSCGVSDWSREDEKISVESLFYRADMALYKAKHSGKNRICTG